MVKAAPDSVLLPTRLALVALLCGAALALTGCGQDRNLSEQVAEANAAAARAESARKAAESALTRLEKQSPAPEPADTEPPVIDGGGEAEADAPMDNAEPVIDPVQDAVD